MSLSETICAATGDSEKAGAQGVVSKSRSEIPVALLTGCQDRPYAFGLAMALVSKGVRLDVVGSDEVDSPEMHSTAGLRFLNMRGSRLQGVSRTKKISKLSRYYARLIGYAAQGHSRILHILWNNRLELFDRTILMAYFKIVGKKVALTAHNVNQARRDANDSWLNRVTLKIQYGLSDHIFVHTEKMKSELQQDFGTPDTKVTVIRHPINNAFPDTTLTPEQAKEKLGLAPQEKAILFFGRIRPYKGIEQLLAAYEPLVRRDASYRLIVAGEPKKGSEEYLAEIERTMRRVDPGHRIVSRIQFIPDEEMEIYLKGADVLVLPYKEIFQSGVLFLSYSFGLPVIAADVGSFREEIIEGKTGVLFRPGDVADLSATIEKYFESSLYKELKTRRREICEYAQAHHSWDAVAELTRSAYASMLRGNAR